MWLLTAKSKININVYSGKKSKIKYGCRMQDDKPSCFGSDPDKDMEFLCSYVLSFCELRNISLSGNNV